MHKILKRKLLIGTIAVATAAFAGGAYAATQDSTNPRKAFLDDVAKRLNVSPQKLSAAMKGAFFDQLQAAVKAGRLTQAQADAIKQHVQKAGAPPFGPGWLGHSGRFGFGHAGRFGAAAQYLGISETQLLDELSSGKSLAQIAAQRGKSVAGLKATMSDAIKARLDRMVAAKMITSAQEQEILKHMSARLDAQIDSTQIGQAFRFRGRMHPGYGMGAMPWAVPGSAGVAPPPGAPAGMLMPDPAAPMPPDQGGAPPTA